MTGMFIVLGCAMAFVAIWAALYSYTPKQKD